MVADLGHITRAAIEEMAERKTDFLGSMPREDATKGRTAPHRLPPSAFIFQPETNRYVCPEGESLRCEGRLKKERGLVSRRYLARAKDCQVCARKPEAQAGYRRRGRVVEFCHAWIKSKLGLRLLHVRGLRKVKVEVLWARLNFDLQQWIRLRRLPTALATGWIQKTWRPVKNEGTLAARSEHTTSLMHHKNPLCETFLHSLQNRKGQATLEVNCERQEQIQEPANAGFG